MPYLTITECSVFTTRVYGFNTCTHKHISGRVRWMSEIAHSESAFTQAVGVVFYANWALRMRDGLVRGRRWLLTKHEYFEFHSRVVL